MLKIDEYVKKCVFWMTLSVEGNPVVYLHRIYFHFKHLENIVLCWKCIQALMKVAFENMSIWHRQTNILSIACFREMWLQADTYVKRIFLSLKWKYRPKIAVGGNKWWHFQNIQHINIYIHGKQPKKTIHE